MILQFARRPASGSIASRRARQLLEMGRRALAEACPCRAFLSPDVYLSLCLKARRPDDVGLILIGARPELSRES